MRIPRPALGSLVAMAFAPGVGVDAAATQDARRMIAVAGPTGRVQVRVAVDPALIDPAGEHRVTELGTRGRLTLVLDSYASHPRSMGRCRAGRERYVRLLDLSAAAERYARLVESCRRDVVAGDPPAAWSPDGRSVTVNLLSEPSVTIGIGAHGRITST